ncbi:DUF5324 family protein [Kitasatospora sp. NBC_00315]|uniref:DUF5324 family protein n=1 Tax=Kitasatospora sp. NBC_00315 TaxID=2975963 RepID=UPI0032472D44
MTRLDSARETADRTKETLAPYAATARDTALHYADEAKQRVGPALEALGPKVGVAAERARTGASHTAQSARVQFDRHVLPQLGHAFSSLPPEAQQNALKAFHRAQEAALAAKLSAARVAGQTKATVAPRVAQAVGDARAAVVPVALEAQTRGAAAITALQGHVTAAEIGELAAKNAKKEQRNGWATGLAVAGTLAIGGGVVAWQWWRRSNSPEWLVEPAVQGGPNTTHSGAHAAGSGPTVAAAGSAVANGNGGPVGGSTSPLNGSAPTDGATGPDADPTAPKPGPTPSPGPPPGKPGQPGPGDDHPKPHDPRKPH